jgi:hypothetical protein
MTAHLSDTDLERYYLGLIPEGPELVALVEHLLWCQECLQRAEESDRYVDAIRAAIVRAKLGCRQWRRCFGIGESP